MVVQNMPTMLPLSETRGLNALLCLAQHNLNRSFWKIVMQFIRKGGILNIPKRKSDVHEDQAGETDKILTVGYSARLLKSSHFELWYSNSHHLIIFFTISIIIFIIHSFIYWFIHPFIHSLIHSVIVINYYPPLFSFSSSLSSIITATTIVITKSSSSSASSTSSSLVTQWFFSLRFLFSFILCCCYYYYYHYHL